MKPMHSLLSAVAILLLTTACEKAPTGQVAAIVDDDEITLQEINSELANLRLPENTDPDVARNIALQRVIDRRLLARVAREEGLDQTPEFFIRQRQLIDDMLIAQLRDKLERGVSTPSEAELQNYAETNLDAAEQRKILVLDQIVFAASESTRDLSALQDDHSMEEVAETLRGLGVRFQRGEAEVDTALLGASRLAQIRELPDGEPFILPGPRVTTVAVIKNERPIASDSRDVSAQIADRMRREELAELLEARLERAKSSAEIQYQEGFGANSVSENEGDG